MRGNATNNDLPFHFWLVAISSCLAFSALMATYLIQFDPQITFSAQIHGPETLRSGHTAAFRATGFNEVLKEPVPVRIASGLMEGPDGKTLVGGTCPGNASDDATATCFGKLPWDSGLVKVTLQVRDANSEELRLVTTTLPVHSRGPAPALSEERLTTTLDNPVAVALVPAVASPMPGGETRYWLRLARRSGEPLAGAKVSWKVGGTDEAAGPWIDLGSTGPTGLATLSASLRGMGDSLFLSIWPDPTTEVTWEQELAADGMLELTASENPQTPGTWKVGVRSASLSQSFYCTLYSEGMPVAFFRTVTLEHRAEMEVEAPASSVSWFTCGNQPVRPDLTAATPLVPRSLRPDLLLQLTATAKKLDPAYPLSRVADLSEPERDLLTDYLVARLAQPALALTQLANTYESQLETATAKVEHARRTLLFGMGLVLLGLLCWTVSVVYRQLKVKQKNLDAFSHAEVPEETPFKGEYRRNWLLLGVVIPSVLNLAGIVFLLSLFV